MAYSSTGEGNASVTLPTAPQQDCDPFSDSTTVKVAKTLAYSLLLVFSLAGNASVVAIFYRNPRLRSTVNFLILSMSVSDLLTAMFALPKLFKRIYLPRGLWHLDGVAGSAVCKIAVFAEETSIIVSITSLELIAIERFFSVVYPMKRQPIRSARNGFIAITGTWILGAAYSSQFFYSMRLIHRENVPYCVYGWEPAFTTEEVSKVEHPLYLTCFTMFPFILLVGLYTSIVASLNNHKRTLHLASSERRRRNQENRRVTIMSAAVVAVFLLSWTPLNIYLFVKTYVWHTRRPCSSRHLIFSAVFLSYCYSAINPVIYCIFSENYRKGFEEMLCCWRRSVNRWEKRRGHVAVGDNGSVGLATINSFVSPLSASKD